MTADELRRAYAETVAARAPRELVDAFAHVPRERFLGPGPWLVAQLGAPGSPYATTPDASLEHVYRDSVVALVPDQLLNNGQPSAHARWIAAARIAPGDSVFHVGCGTGYYTAILAELVGGAGRVIACDVEPELVARAAENLAPWSQAQVFVGDASDLRGEHDAIYVNAGATHPRTEWLDALRPGGRLVVPLTMHVPQLPHGVGLLLALERRDPRWPVQVVSQIGIYDCVGARDPAEQAVVRTLARAGEMIATREPHERGDACLLHRDRFCLQRA